MTKRFFKHTCKLRNTYFSNHTNVSRNLWCSFTCTVYTLSMQMNTGRYLEHIYTVYFTVGKSVCTCDILQICCAWLFLKRGEKIISSGIIPRKFCIGKRIWMVKLTLLVCRNVYQLSWPSQWLYIMWESLIFELTCIHVAKVWKIEVCLYSLRS